MPDSDHPKKGLDAASSINAFLSQIPQSGKSRIPFIQRTEEVTDKHGEINNTEHGTKEKSNVASAVSSAVPSVYASPQSKTSDSLPAEKMNEWLHANAPADHFKTKNPLLENVQAQSSPLGSPQATGVLAPPSTPETLSNYDIGLLISEELDKIPPERFTLLSESRFAKNQYNRQGTTHHSSSILSPIPRLNKPRDDLAYTRMTFQAADTPTVPAWVTAKSSVSEAEKSFGVRGPPQAPQLKENLRGGHANGELTHPATSHDANGTKTSTLTNDSTRPVAPHLKCATVNEIKPTKVFTPDTPDDKVDGEEKEQEGVRLPIRTLQAQPNSFSPVNLTHPPKEEGKATIGEAAAAISQPAPHIKPLDLTIDTSGDISGGPLTPSSMIFTAVSPTKVREAGITTADTEPAKVVEGNLEGALYFKAWPKVEDRASRTGKSSSSTSPTPITLDLLPGVPCPSVKPSKPTALAAQHRKVVLTGIPWDSSPTFIASLVYGGPLECIVVSAATAFVTFLRADDAMKYYGSTGNGLLYKRDGTEYVIMTELGKDVDPVSGVLGEWIQKEFTRCVRAVGVDKDWTVDALYETAAKKGRKVEKVLDGANVNKVSYTGRTCISLPGRNQEYYTCLTRWSTRCALSPFVSAKSATPSNSSKRLTALKIGRTAMSIILQTRK